MAKTVDKHINIWVNGSQVENNMKSIQQAIKHVSNQLKQSTIGSEEYIAASKKLRDLKSIYEEHNKDLQSTNNILKENTKESRNAAMAAGGVAAVVQTASGAVRRFIDATQEYVEAYASMDDAMTNVSKYTGLTREEVKQLNEEFRKMDTRTPTEKLNALAADAGRLGITSKEAIKDFVEAADIINVALGEDLGEDAVKNVGKMATMFGESDRLGLRGAMIATASAVNTLAQSSSASEPYIMDFTARLSGIANTAGITQAQIMGIASAMDQNMGQVEKSATAVQKVMMDMMSKTEKYANLVGMTTEEFRNLVDNDMNTAFLTVIDTFNKINESGPSALADTLADLKLKGAGVQETLLTLASHTDQLRESQSLATQAYADGNSVINEAAAVNNNAAAQLEKAKKRMQDMKVELGEKLIPIMTKMYEILSSSATWLTKHTELVKLVASAVGAYMLIVGAANAKMKIHNAYLLISNGYHKAHRAVVLASAAAQAAFEKDTARANRALALSGKNLPGVTGAFGKLGTSIKGIATAFLRFMKIAPITFIASIAAAVWKVNRNVNEGKRAVEEITKASKERYSSEIASIETEKVKIAQLREIINSENASREEKMKAIQKLQGIIPGYVAELSEEGRVIRENTSAIDDYIQKMQERVQLGILESQYQELETKRQEIMDKYNERKKEDYNFFGHLHNTLWYDWDNPDGNSFQKSLADIAQEENKVLDKMKELRTVMGETINPEQPQQSESGTVEDAQQEARKAAENARKKLLEDRKQFQKRLKDFNEAERLDTLNEWEKTKAGIVKKYQEMIDEADKLYGKGNAYSQQLSTELPRAVTRAANEYLKNYSKEIEAFANETKRMLGTINKDDQNAFISEILGTEQQWDEHISKARENVAFLQSILNSMAEDDPDRSIFETAIRKNIDAITDAELGKEQAKLAVIGSYINSYTQLVKDAEDEILMNDMTDLEKKQYLWEKEKEAKKKSYDAQIEIAKSMLDAQKALAVGDDETIERIETLISKLQQLKDKVDEMKSPDDGSEISKKSHTGVLSFLDIDKNDPYTENIKRAIESLNELYNVAFDVYTAIAECQRNAAEAEMKSFTEAQDQKSKTLQRQLDTGLISQKYYDAQMEKMEDEKNKRERKLNRDQWEREKKANLGKAIIEGALAASNSFANGGGFPWGLIPMALSLVTTGAQIGIIASQVNPYARGGFITKKQLALMGEEGKEWVASNMLLEDEKTAPIIAALEEYQRGNNKALEMMMPSNPDWISLSQSATKISSNFAPNQSPTVNNYYSTSAENTELLDEVKRMNKFLSDPKNRQAYISYRIQTESTTNRDFIKKASAL